MCSGAMLYNVFCEFCKIAWGDVSAVIRVVYISVDTCVIKRGCDDWKMVFDALWEIQYRVHWIWSETKVRTSQPLLLFAKTATTVRVMVDDKLGHDQRSSEVTIVVLFCVIENNCIHLPLYYSLKDQSKVTFTHTLTMMVNNQGLFWGSLSKTKDT